MITEDTAPFTTPAELNPLYQYAGVWLRFSEAPHEWSEFVGSADKVLTLRHTGWYVDAHQDHTQCGVVRKLEHNGDTRYFACVSDPYNGEKSGEGPCCVRCECDGTIELYDTAEDAARAADRAACITAEAMVDYDVLWQERQAAEDSFEDCTGRRKQLLGKARKLIREMRKSDVSVDLRDDLLAIVREHRKTAARLLPVIKEAKETMERLKDYS